MNYYEVLQSHAENVDISPTDTSYFSKPSAGLDPRLFRDGKLLSNVRDAILVLLHNHLRLGYHESESWAHAYLTGSGVSYTWAAHRDPGDLDCLVAIDYVTFRQSNQEYKGWSDREIASEITQGFRNELQPRTDNFMGEFELTFYANLNPNIKEMRPYAAYSVTQNTWVVPPMDQEAPNNPEWELAVTQDASKAAEIIKRYASALEQVTNAKNDAMRINAERALANAVQQGSALFDLIHADRSSAFSPGGAGYYDFANYRWQSGKKSGVIQAMRKLKDIQKDAESRFSTETYGVDLPDVSTLIRRAQR